VTRPLLKTRLAIDPTAFVARNAVLVGEVTVGPRASVWYGAVLRADIAPIEVGADSNVQDGVVIHVEEGIPTRLGERVTVGHGAIIHAADVEDDSLIAIGAIVLTGAKIGRGSIVGAGTLIREGFNVAPYSLVIGVPGKIARTLTEVEKARVQENWRAYAEYAAGFREGKVE